jgi:Zn-dependent protease with chaperone function
MASAIAILQMGPHGWMVWGWEGWVSYWLAVAFLGFSLFCLVRTALIGWEMIDRVRAYPLLEIDGNSVRVLEINTPYSAQIGFWQPELVVSQGLLDTLPPAHRQAVLAHERAHYHYRDTFWFFWLGWLRQVSSWLPHSTEIWEELLILRELRADRWAAQETDSLLLAETLLLVVQNNMVFEDSYCAAFNQVASPDRLTQRIEALINLPASVESTNWWQWKWLIISLLPLLAVPLHR